MSHEKNIMKSLASLTLLILICSKSYCQADNWYAIETSGFSNTDNPVVHEFMVFKDTLYACLSKTGPGQAELWRSGTGDANDWERVFYDPLNTTTKGIPSISTSNLDNGYMWMMTGDPLDGSRIYRTEDGLNWQPISDYGFGDSTRWSPSPNIQVYQGTLDTIPYLYAGVGTHGGVSSAQVWRAPYNTTNPTDWEIVMDFDTRDPSCTQITYFHIWNNTLFFGGNGDTLLYQTTDGSNFIHNQGVFDYFSNQDKLIACMNTYNGYYYASTLNFAEGGHLYRSLDGIIWDDLTGNIANYNALRDEELHNLDVSNGYLWVTSYTDTANSNGSIIWRSSDASGVNFVQSNNDGFNNSDNDGENAVSIGFKNRQYFGGPNYQQGGQIYRTDEFLTSAAFETAKIELYPNPINLNESLNVTSKREIVAIQIYTINGQELVENVTISNNSAKVMFEKPGVYIVKVLTLDESPSISRVVVK